MKSVIIPTWNAGALIDGCLASISGQLAADDELIVIDNASHDGTPDHIAARYPQVQLVRLPENLGFAGGINRGLQRAHGDELILINQDVALRAGCLAALSAQLAAGPAIVGAKLLYPDGVTVQHAGGLITWPRALPNHYGYRQIDDGRWDEVKEVDYVTGALFAFNRPVLEAIGLLDEGFYPAYYEEVDYCYRARAAGARVIYEPAAVALHHETQSIDQRSPAYHQAMERGRLRFVLKHGPPGRLFGDFFPAELDYVQQVPADFARAVCVPAYDEVLKNLPPLPSDRAASIVHLLRQLRAAAVFTSAAAYQQPVTNEAPMPEPFPPLDVPALREHEFRSNVPVVGPLITGVRRALYSLTAKWPLRVALDQQTHINQQLAQRLLEHDTRLSRYETQLREHETQLREFDVRQHEFEARLSEFEARLIEHTARLSEFDARLIEQDRDLTHLIRAGAELQIQWRAQLRSGGSPVSGLETSETQEPVSSRL
jgi:GT2 family glycosyltransferase